ncbi:hypothetical protein BS47DRAFT_1393885 [Hydnum rufescens UP504]|uniref:DEAD/DEAH-box helicase domain-containing protein n=1 Tax=Hydnum rufescens UP504 TaxID=1448309 RepID=A0A9P6AVU6_9AGAM|nr:hypothetical protein BS47DRAFT_1393885 [Hydnum rufescens UP504]
MTNVFIGAPTGIGKTICTEFSLLRLWSKSDAPCAVCIEPYQDVVDQRVSEWRKKFGNLQGREEIVGLTGVTSADLRILEKGARVFVHPVSASGGPRFKRLALSRDFLLHPGFLFDTDFHISVFPSLVSHLLCSASRFPLFMSSPLEFPKYLASITNFVDEHSS